VTLLWGSYSNVIKNVILLDDEDEEAKIFSSEVVGHRSFFFRFPWVQSNLFVALSIHNDTCRFLVSFVWLPSFTPGSFVGKKGTVTTITVTVQQYTLAVVLLRCVLRTVSLRV